jgi:type IV pilus assembly protein PilV
VSHRSFAHRGRGFSLVEVLVALMVTSVGVLGVVKIQALALSGTGTARARSLVAFAAASLASTMHADRAYWANVTADPAVTVDVKNATLAASDPTLLSVPSGGCTLASPCAAAGQLAALDLRDWADSLRTILPASTNPAATVSCQVTGNNPVTCAIRIAWSESVVATPYSTNTAATAQQAAQALQQVEPVSYTVYAEP